MPPLSFLDSSQFKYQRAIPGSFREKVGYPMSSEQGNAEQDRYFEIIISKRRPSQEALDRNEWNYLKLDEEEDGTLIVRQTFGRRDKERMAIIRLERFDVDLESQCDDEKRSGVRPRGRLEERPRPLTPVQVDEALSSASRLVVGAALMFSNWGNRMRESKEHINALPVRLDQTEYVTLARAILPRN